MKTAWTLTCLGAALFVSSLVIAWARSSDNSPVNSGTIVLTALAVAGVLLLLWFVPKVQVRHLGPGRSAHHFDSENEARKSLAQIFGGIAFLATFYVSWANYNIEADKAVTETFGKAVEQLSNKDMSVRIGGAYILERLSKSSPMDYDSIIAILAQAVRDHGQEDLNRKKITDATIDSHAGERPKAPSDVEALIRILGRRAKLSTGAENRLNLGNSNINGVQIGGARDKNLNFQWAYLIGSQMQAVSMYGVHFENAELDSVNASLVRVPRPDATTPPSPLDNCLDPEFFTHELVGTNFSCGHFKNAILVGGNFEGASFNDADLTGARLNHGNFQRGHFDQANLFQADLTGADLRGADLSGAVGVTKSQWDSARTDKCSREPRFDTNSSSWTAVRCGQ
jgi:Pentapeptide repeats (8 copies)